MPINTDHPLIVASRYADAQAEEHGLIGAIRFNNIDEETLIYAAQQRALRMVLLTNRGPQALTSLSRVHPTQIKLSKKEQDMLESYAIAYLDGLFIGWKAANINNEEN